ncbi:chloroplast protein FOR GROWTH AND FERTILITY 2-like [Diospyros lotus]|uniref:chloroplast protein FOR GROWTH AND FERTILITY 2-like n=1 Tax=Diospyros lotus TaxID=55363 RepID=UPI00224E655E|nr:chloroplast protein FOR GROWTH AND FERTILITY 2-like [Diospyros lotus]
MVVQVSRVDGAGYYHQAFLPIVSIQSTGSKRQNKAFRRCPAASSPFSAIPIATTLLRQPTTLFFPIRTSSLNLLLQMGRSPHPMFSHNSPKPPPPQERQIIQEADRIRGIVNISTEAVATGTVVLLSALIVILIHPVIVSPAFATFQSAATAGAAAAAGRGLFRSELLTSAWTGFFAGCLHTLSGPDHLAALAPLSIGRSRLESAIVGALWGCGHDAGQVIFGLLFLLLKDRLHIEIIRTWGTRVVGFTLLIIGAMGIREASEVPSPCVALENGECDVSVYETLENPTIGKKKEIGFATFATGIVHGLQPDALMMVLPALALPSRVAGAAFLGMFLLGTVVAMGTYTVFIGSCSEALKERVPRITEKLTWASSLVAIGLGFAIIISQFFGFSLY